MKKWMIVTIIIVYSILIGLIVYYSIDNNNRKKELKEKVEILETNLDEYYKNKYNSENIGKLFIFPGETNIEFNDDGIVSGEAFIYEDGTFEIALFDGKFCAYKKDELSITRTDISECITNR